MVVYVQVEEKCPVRVCRVDVGSRGRVISGVGTGDENVTRHPPGIPGITRHGHIINIVTSYHHLKRDAAKREEGREWAYMVRPPFLLLVLLFLTIQL